MSGEDSLVDLISPFIDEESELTVHLIPQSHIDLAWHWRWSDTVKMIYETLKGHASILEENPEATYVQSQVHIYWTVENLFPKLFDRIKNLVGEGRWEIVGGEWVEPDHMLPSGESLVRQFLEGQLYLRRKFGVTAKIGWSPDSFGHTPNLPQIMLKCGLNAFVFKRPREKFMSLPETPFWWIGLDGSKILSLRVNNKGRGLPQVSEGRILPEDMHEITYLQREFGKCGIHNLWGTLGVGDTGGVNKYPEPKTKGRLRIVYSTPSIFFKKVREEMKSIPSVKGELGRVFTGTYTTHIDMKEMNRKAETQIFITEFLASLAMVFGQPYPEKEIKRILRLLLFNQFHDIIAGTSTPEVHSDSRHDFLEIFRVSEELQRRSIYFLSEIIDTRGPGKPIIIFNPLNWERTDVVEMEITPFNDAEAFEVVDASGFSSPVQIVGERSPIGWKRLRIVFIAADVPPLGYKVMWLKPSEKIEKKRSIYRNIAETDTFRVVGDPASGYISSIFDKRLNREIIQPGKKGSRWLIFEEGYYIQDYNNDMRAWNLGLTGKVEEAEKEEVPKLLEEGPVRVTLALKHRFKDSTFEQNVHVYNGFPRVDVSVKIRWEEIEELARLEFPFNLKDAKLIAEVPFGAIQRPTDGTEFPAHRWVDLSGDWGISLLNNARYGHSAENNHVRMSIIRCSTQPDPRSDYGEYAFEYSIFPHRGGWRESGVYRMGCAFNIPLIGVEAESHDGVLPSQLSLFSMDPNSIIISALKKAEESDDLILRLYEAVGSKVNSEIRVNNVLPLLDVEETNLIEDSIGHVKVSNGKILTVFSPFEIKTFRIRISRG